MAAEIVTVEDLDRFRIRLLADLGKLMQKPDPVEPLLRSGQVERFRNYA